MTKPDCLSKWVSIDQLRQTYELKDFEILQHIQNEKLTPYSAFEKLIECPPKHHIYYIRIEQEEGLQRLNKRIASSQGEDVRIPHEAVLTTDLLCEPAVSPRGAPVSKDEAIQYAEKLEVQLKIFCQTPGPHSWKGLYFNCENRANTRAFIDKYLKDAFFPSKEVEKLFENTESTTTTDFLPVTEIQEQKPSKKKLSPKNNTYWHYAVR